MIDARNIARFMLIGIALPACSAQRVDERPVVNFWPIVHCTAPTEGDGYHVTAVGTLFRASKDENERVVSLGPIFNSTHRGGEDETSFGFADIAKIWSSESGASSSEWTVLGAFDLFAVADHESDQSKDGDAMSSRRKFSFLSVFNNANFSPIGAFRRNAMVSDDPSKEFEETHSLYVLNGNLFDLWAANRFPKSEHTLATKQKTNEDGTTEEVECVESHYVGHDYERNVVSVFDGSLFALEHSSVSASGEFDWSLIRILNGFSLARSEGKQDASGRVTERRMSFLGPVFQRIDEPDRSWTSLAFLFGFERAPEGSTLRLFHLIPIRF